LRARFLDPEGARAHATATSGSIMRVGDVLGESGEAARAE